MAYASNPPLSVDDDEDFAMHHGHTPVDFMDENWEMIPADIGAESFAQVSYDVGGGEKQELECNCEKMKCNCMKKCECAVPKKR